MTTNYIMRESEVDDLNTAFPIEENIFKFDISVDNISGSTKMNCFHNLPINMLCFYFRKTRFFDDIQKVYTVKVFHSDKYVVCNFKSAKKFHDVWMAFDHSHDMNFIFHLFSQKRKIDRKVGGQEFLVETRSVDNL